MESVLERNLRPGPFDRTDLSIPASAGLHRNLEWQGLVCFGQDPSINRDTVCRNPRHVCQPGFVTIACKDTGRGLEDQLRRFFPMLRSSWHACFDAVLFCIETISDTTFDASIKLPA